MRKLMLAVAVAVMVTLVGCIQPPEVRTTEEGAVVLGIPLREIAKEKPEVANGDSAQYVAIVDEWIVVRADSWENLMEKLDQRPPAKKLVILPSDAEGVSKHIAPSRLLY